MLFSEVSKVRWNTDGWFDLIRDMATPLFVGSFLIFQDNGTDWTGMAATVAPLVASRCRVRL